MLTSSAFAPPSLCCTRGIITAWYVAGIVVIYFTTFQMPRSLPSAHPHTHTRTLLTPLANAPRLPVLPCQGYYQLGYRNPEVQTPFIDQLAAESLMLDQH